MKVPAILPLLPSHATSLLPTSPPPPSQAGPARPLLHPPPPNQQPPFITLLQPHLAAPLVLLHSRQLVVAKRDPLLAQPVIQLGQECRQGLGRGLLGQG
jgi:hypothetical protein